MMKTLIIEDERIPAERLRDMLLRLRPGMDVSGPVRTVRDAEEYIRRHPELDLILSDIRLEDGNCFECFDKISTKAMIVFTTAYDEYALKAFDYNCVDYLMKPVSSRELETALSKCERRTNLTSDSVIHEVSGDIIHQTVCYRKRLMLNRGEELMVCSVPDICFIETQGGYTRVFLMNGKWGATTISLQELASSLPQDTFFRLSRQVIVNINMIHSLVPAMNRDSIVSLKMPYPDKQFQISPERRKKLLLLLDQ